jgi:hypothetical protein
MMSIKLKTFNKVFNNVVQNNLRFLYFTRAIEFQTQAIADFESLLKKTSYMKKEMIKQKNEKMSNELLSLENLLLAYINELRMYVYLKKDDMNKAWESLVNAQSALRTAFQADDIVIKYNGEAYMQKLELIEKSFFPHQTFDSIEAKAHSSDCSICGREYGTCGHLVGKPYMGEICYRIMRGLEFQGLAILVENPASKHHRVTQISDNEYMRDVMTWRISKPISDELRNKMEQVDNANPSN